MARSQPDIGRVARTAFEQLWGGGSVSVSERFFSPAVANRAMRHVALVRQAFPDFAPTVLSETISGDTVVLRWDGRGTHKGRFAGLAPTGRTVTWSGVTIFRFGGEQIVDRRSLWDIFDILEQVGALD